MTGLGNILFLLVRSECDIPRAWREVGELLTFQRARLSAVHQAQERSLIGMWVDPLMVDMHPEVFGRPADSGHCPFRIRESVGVNRLWELCWLDADLGPGVNDPGTIREILISALIEERKPRHPPPTCRFSPIFDAEEKYDLIHRQTDHLRGLFPGLIGEPVTWNKATGAMATLSPIDDRDTQF